MKDSAIYAKSSRSVKVNSFNKHFEKIEKYIPKKMKKELNEEQKSQLISSTTYATLEAISLMIAEPESPWTKKFKEREFSIERIIPVFDFDGDLSENLVVFNEGYIIVDAVDGGITQFSFGKVDLDYFDNGTKLYGNSFDRFIVDDEGKIHSKDGKNGKRFKDIKNEVKKIKNEKKENKWGDLNDEIIEKSISIYYGGTNNGEDEDFITDPRSWLYSYYLNMYPNLRNFDVSGQGSALSNISEINQDASPWTTYANDCAVISTLELLTYYYKISSTQQKTAYNAITKSIYFSEIQGGVTWYNNDDIFKVGADAIGKPQKVEDDDWFLGPDIDTYVSEWNAGRDGYVSIDCAPYGAHTVTFIGYSKYKSTFIDQFNYSRTYYDNFIRINDHWNTTTSDAFLNLGRTASSFWYFTSITKN